MPAVPFILAATAVVGTGVSIYEGNKAAKLSKEANDIQRQQADLVGARQNRDAIRQARIANANAGAAAERQGVGMSSGAQGGQGSIVSQLNDTLSFLDQYNAFSDQASHALGRAASYRQSAEGWGQVAGAAEQAIPYSKDIQRGLSSASHKIFGGT